MHNKDFIQSLYRHHNTIQAHLPDKELSQQFIDHLYNFLFIPRQGINSKEHEIEKTLHALKNHLSTLIYEVTHDVPAAQEAAEKFFSELPGLYEELLNDAKAFIANDPAALNLAEVLNAYPGFYAISVYRMANSLWKQHIKILPRVFAEYAHSKTGIDIHPGATIGQEFFIDHGTGVVIGETAVIGNKVKVYQGVTVGAFNSEKNKHAERRHPKIEDNVILYSGATVLGGDTVIGRDSIIGANVWLTHSLPQASLVFHKSEVVRRDKDSVATLLMQVADDELLQD